MPKRSKVPTKKDSSCINKPTLITDILIPINIEALNKEDRKKIKEAVEASKKVTPPKRFYYHTDKQPESYFELFNQSDEWEFECPHCGEIYCLSDRQIDLCRYDGCQKEEFIPDFCEHCCFRMDIHQKVMWFCNWVVTLYGVESLTQHYFIHYKQLHYDNWIDHMKEKSWVKIDEFAQALTYARMFFYPDKYLPPYQKYLRSNHWKILKNEALNYYGYCCALCGTEENLNVHHRNYKNLNKEIINKDLIVLCRECHKKFHNKD
jgi:hypothetical protein